MTPPNVPNASLSPETFGGPERVNGGLALTLPPDLLDAIASRVAELLTPQSGPEPWIGVGAAAEHLACGTSRIYALTSARRIPHRKDGSRLLFRRSELDAWIERGGDRRP